jgi:CBS domain-containing protein
MATETPLRIRNVMTPDPLTIEEGDNVADAAKAMAGADVGPIPVIDAHGSLSGLLTDRDIAVRVVAADLDPKTTRVGQVASKNLVTLSGDASVDEAVAVMRENALRRVPVVEDSRLIGIVSLGDLARDLDPNSALADISKASANN